MLQFSANSSVSWVFLHDVMRHTTDSPTLRADGTDTQSPTFGQQGRALDIKDARDVTDTWVSHQYLGHVFISDLLQGEFPTQVDLRG